MQILVINGSPRGHYSVTLQTVLYLKALHPEHEFRIFHAANRIRTLEKDPSGLIGELKEADLVLFSYPVYTFLAPSQLHRLIEILKESGETFPGLFATQLTTSKHFYDITAHKYLEQNIRDLGMQYIPGLSADMDDLSKKKGQKQARDFFDHTMWVMERAGAFRTKKVSGDAGGPESVRSRKKVRLPKKPVVIVADLRPEDASLADMIHTFQSAYPGNVRFLNLRDFHFRGGCLGCLNCAADGKCIYNDGFETFLRDRVQTGCAIVYAFTVRDHSMGSLMKTFDDRQFCNGHRTVTMGMPVAYLISGNYRQEENLRMVVEARASTGGNYLAGVATNEQDAAASVRTMTKELIYALGHAYDPPMNFYGVGGMRIFRDLIYLMRGMMKADHKFFKEHDQYDFPQKKKGTAAAMYLVGGLLSNKKIRKKMGNKMNEGMLAPYRKVLDEVNREQEP